MMKSQQRYSSDEPERQEMHLDGVGASRDQLADRMFSIATRLNELADRIYGPPPPSPLSEGVSGKATGIMDTIHREIDRCDMAQRAIEDALGRLSTLA
jgi:hypothetical protein